MSLHFMRLYYRYLRSNRSITFINILGLTIALTAIIPIGLYVANELNYDTYFEDGDRIARLVIDARIGSDQPVVAPIGSAPMGPVMTREIDGIEQYCRIDAWGAERPVTYNEQTFLEANILWVDSSFFDIFSFPFVVGDPATALTTKFSVVITESTAKKYFGDEDPLGRQLMLSHDERWKYTVTGVMRDIDQQTHFPDFPMLCSWVTRHEGIDDEMWINNVNWLIYFKLSEGAAIESLNEEMNNCFERHAGDIMRQIGGSGDVSLQRLNEMYLDSNHFGFYTWPRGSWASVIQFIVIGAFILIIAMLNFINLTTARSMNRGRQVGISKVLGASRGHLVRQYLLESVLISTFSAILAMLFTSLFIEHFANLLNVDIEFSIVRNPAISLLILAGAALLGVIAGYYPAWFLTGYNPVSVMRGQLRTGTKGKRIRAAFVILQYSMSIMLIVCTMLALRQLNYIRHKDLGFDQEQIVALRLPNWDLMTRHEVLQTEMMHLAGVTGTADSDQLPHDTANNSIYHIPGMPPDGQIYLAGQRIGYDYVTLLGMDILEGRNFNRDISTDTLGAIILNETAVRMLGWENIDGKYIEDFESLEPPVYIELPVIGMVRDFHFSSLHSEVRPLMLRLYVGEPVYTYFKLAPGTIPETMAEIENVWNEFAPGIPMDYLFLDDLFANAYRSEERLSRLFHFFTWLAIFVASLGLFALASFSAEQRTREIGVRKVVGASVPGIIGLLIWDFLKLILVANIIAWPFAAWIMLRWLENFAYTPSFGWWLFPLAGIGALALAVLTVSSQAWRAALANPVNSLRIE